MFMLLLQATKLLRTLIRCYAALAFVMPLMLGSLPSGMMKDVDHYAMLVRCSYI